MTTPRLKNVTPHSDAGQEVHYPIDDDEPLAESEYQFFPLTYAHAALTGWYENDPTTWVGADMFVYYEEEIPSSVVAPDVFVVTCWSTASTSQSRCGRWTADSSV